ncbi:hypothetical protein K438DRAFT_1781549 [Mycena galopus ATCC 62051]|nr:hypothetical protein K438DRAFT_1781549 [Mycena galopus ATCC 62051]
MSNKGNYIASLSRVAAWLGGIAEELVYPGFASAQFLLSPSPNAQGRKVRSMLTHDAGLIGHCTKGPRFDPGMAFRARATLLAEGALGSPSKQAVAMYDLSHGKEAQTYGIGIKDASRIEDGKHVPVLARKVLHTLSWPLSAHTYGGGWEYHMADGLVSIGLVVGLDYKSPYIEPYRVFQIKGTHNAMRTGLLAAEAAFAALHPAARFVSAASPGTFRVGEMQKGRRAPLLARYTAAFPRSPVPTDLWAVRNVRPGFNTRWGAWGGELHAEFNTMLGGRVPWKLRHHKETSLNPSASSPDALATLPAASFSPISCPPFEPPLSTDLMSSIALTGTNHAEGEAVHLRVMRANTSTQTSSGTEADEDAPPDTDPHENPARRRAHVHANVGTYDGSLRSIQAIPKRRRRNMGGDEARYHFAELHPRKLCDIKVLTQDITWLTPEGGGGSKYALT